MHEATGDGAVRPGHHPRLFHLALVELPNTLLGQPDGGQDRVVHLAIGRSYLALRGPQTGKIHLRCIEFMSVLQQRLIPAAPHPADDVADNLAALGISQLESIV